jgi:hypothetical protein
LSCLATRQRTPATGVAGSAPEDLRRRQY